MPDRDREGERGEREREREREGERESEREREIYGEGKRENFGHTAVQLPVKYNDFCGILIRS